MSVAFAELPVCVSVLGGQVGVCTLLSPSTARNLHPHPPGWAGCLHFLCLPSQI